MWYHFDPEEVEKMLKLESQQNYIYLGKTDQGLSLLRQKATGILKNISSFTNQKNPQTNTIQYFTLHLLTSSKVYALPEIDSRHPSIKHYANHKVISGLLWEGTKWKRDMNKGLENSVKARY